MKASALLLSVLLLAACGGGDSSGGDAVEEEGVSGKVVLAHWASSPVETELLDQVLADFRRAYPKIDVTRRALDPYPDSMLAQFAARKPPDVFYVDSNVAPDWIAQGVLEPLDGYIEENEFDTGPFFDPLLEAFAGPDGKTYGIPKDWSPLATFTNDALLQDAGVEPPATWEELRAAAEQVRVPGGKPICLSPSWDRLLAFVYQGGGAFLGEDGEEATLDSPEAAKAVDYYVGLIEDGLAGTPATLGSTWCGEALGKGKAAIVFEGNWLVPTLEEQFPDVAYTISPLVEGEESANLAFTVSYSIARDSKQKDAAWVLLSYLTGPEGMGKWTSKGLALPSREDVEPVEGREPFIEAAESSRPWQFAPRFTKVIDRANNELTALIEGKTTTDAMLKAVDEEAERALQRAR